MMDTFTGPLLLITWNLTQLYAQYVRYCKLSVFMWSRKNLKSRIPLCSPCDSRIPTPQKHEIPLPLVAVIPTSRPCFQIKSRISRQKNAKSRIPPNLLGTLYKRRSLNCKGNKMLWKRHWFICRTHYIYLISGKHSFIDISQLVWKATFLLLRLNCFAVLRQNVSNLDFQSAYVSEFSGGDFEMPLHVLEVFVNRFYVSILTEIWIHYTLVT